MSLKKLNYIGSKYSLLSFIEETIKEEASIDDLSKIKFVDVFSGTSSVGFHFRNLGCSVVSNDIEYYSFVICKAAVCCNYTKKLKGLINEINSVEPVIGIISKNYSEDGENKRMYFTVENARKIDAMRIKLEQLKQLITEEEYYFLLASILVSADAHANVASVYGAYLKNYKKVALKEIELKPIHEISLKNRNRVYNEDCLDFIDKIGNVDCVYLDPPYNERQYGKNYHVLNYIARYDESVEIYGKTGLIKDTRVSDWCLKGRAKIVLDKLLERLSKKVRYVFMSYNNEGIIGQNDIREIFEKYFETKVVTKEYRRFKSNNNETDADATIEYIWVGKRL